MDNKFNLVAPCLFGTESIATFEFKRMGFEDIITENGRILLKGDANLLARANISSSFSERILINVGEFIATSFTELFDNVKSLPWENFIRKDDAFPVNGWSISSALHSIPDCQSIIKKAIVERLKEKYKISWFEETGTEIKIRFSIHKDKVTMMIDTSGEGLHKRGYRRNSNDAPLKETLAASICDLARIYPDTQIYDPMCGSGTFLIESAMMAKGIAPGLRRSFSAERFSFIDERIWREERTRAQDLIRKNIEFSAVGYDIDPKAVELTLNNAKKAGVEKYVRASVGDVKDFVLPNDRCITVTNPPYGERLLDVKSAEKLYSIMGERFVKQEGHKFFIISPHDEFEKHFGRTADKRRKLYNGMIKCQLFMYLK
ncbi:MAG: class I SAM-dependent RNA methyltransferase [Clostridia bacterium]|nr:class I SAM-dependent RNA methyltransferase [Clostridia bacterium]